MLCAALALVLSAMVSRQVRDDRGIVLDLIAQAAARTFADGLAERLREAQSLAEASDLWADGLDTPNVASALKRSQAMHPGNTWIGVADASGIVRCATGGLLVGNSVTQRPWFARGLAGTYVGDVHPAALLASLLPMPTSGEPIRFVDFAAPIKVGGRAIGVVAIHGTWEWASQVVRSLLPADASSRSLDLFIFDRAGKVLYAPSGALPAAEGAGQNLNTLKTAKVQGTGAAAWRIADWSDGRAYLTTIVRVPAAGMVSDLGWSIVAREPADRADAQARRSALFTLGSGAVIAALATALAWWLSGLVSRPLTSIARAAIEVERGTPGAEIPIFDRSEELHHLSTALAGMTGRLNATIQTAPVGICQVDADGRVVASNRRLCEILGRTDDALRGRRFSERVVAAERPAVERGLAQLLEGDIETYVDERRLIQAPRESAARPGEYREIDAALCASLVKQRGGAAPYFIVVVEDITPRKQGEAAERANAAKTSFVSQMSHELRTPLNAVLGFTQLMQLDAREPLTPAQQTRARKIADAGAHLLAMIDDILDLSRIESGRLSLSPEPVSLPAVLEQSSALVAALVRDASVTLRIEPPPDEAALPVRADRVRLQQVLVNLLSNAIKYNRAGGSVVVSWRSGTEAGTVELTVADTGQGLRPEQLARLFEPFNRLGAEATAIPGAGIGLVVTRKLVELMDGSISVRSEAGVGSRFTIVLPASTTAALPRPALRSAEPLPEANSASRTVLYAEDNELNIELVSEVMRLRPHWRLVIARSGHETLKLAQADPPDLFMLDMHLGDMTGLTLARQLKRHTGLQTIPCIALSADAMPGSVKSTLEAGFAAYLTKPLDLNKFLDCLDNTLKASATA